MAGILNIMGLSKYLSNKGASISFLINKCPYSSTEICASPVVLHFPHGQEEKADFIERRRRKRVNLLSSPKLPSFQAWFLQSQPRPVQVLSSPEQSAPAFPPFSPTIPSSLALTFTHSVISTDVPTFLKLPLTQKLAETTALRFWRRVFFPTLGFTIQGLCKQHPPSCLPSHSLRSRVVELTDHLEQFLVHSQPQLFSLFFHNTCVQLSLPNQTFLLTTRTLARRIPLGVFRISLN
jgi:hypothetical protein